MLKLRSKPKPIGTSVPCPACRYPNLGIDIWCERCGTPLDWNGEKAAVTTPPAQGGRRGRRNGHGLLHGLASAIRTTTPSMANPVAAHSVPPTGGPPSPSAAAPEADLIVAVPPPLPPPIAAAVHCTRCGAGMDQLARFCTNCGSPMAAMPTVIRQAPLSASSPRLSLPRLPRFAWVVAVVVAILLIVPLAYLLLPGIRGGAAKVVPSTPKAAAIPGVEAKTGLHYTTAKCASSGPCLAAVSQTLGQGAAAVVFSTAVSGGRQCVGYVYRVPGGWHFLDATCALPGQLSPMVGHDATIRVAANCANVRDGAGFKARVVACLHNGSVVHVDGGPSFADGRLWWHEPQGWIAHEFLVGP